MRATRVSLVRGLGALMLAALGGCAFDSTVVALRTPLVEVHAILNTSPLHAEQVILVERILTGGLGDTSASGGVAAIHGAVVTITGPTGKVYVATDTVPLTDGVLDERKYYYHIRTEGANALLPGSTYTLRVVTPTGEVVTGSTKIPAQKSVLGSTAVLFNRETDTLRVAWPAVQGAAAYWVRVDGPTTSFEQFTDSTHVRLSGDLKSLSFNADQNRVFSPGYSAPVTVAAIDQNCYDYFRTASDPFTGLGRVNRLVGGYGVFGSVTTIASVGAEVTETVTVPSIEGHWQLITGGSAAQARMINLRLYVDRGHPSGDPSVLNLIGTFDNSKTNGRQPVVATLTGLSLLVGLFNGISGTPDDIFIATLGSSLGTAVLRGSYDSDGFSAVFQKVTP